MPEHQIVLYSSEIGMIELVGTEQGLLSIRFLQGDAAVQIDAPECLRVCVTQLDEYFRGTRQEFSVPLDIQGTDFEKQVWNAVAAIPYGTTRSYLDIAKTIGNPKAVRAVGLANGKNPLPIIIPCHRVIGSNGSLTGYGGGIWRKKWLLKHEGACLF